MIDLEKLTIEKAHTDLKDGKYTAVDLANAYLLNIKEKNKELNAYLEVYDDVLEQAQKADERIKSGNTTMLTGIPIALKDNILVEGKIASAASKILANYHATYDATVIKKLKDAGAVFLGRANMDEFAMGGSTENSAYGPSRNPYDTSRVPGGSSGGSAVAVAGNLALAALGTDTGGSVRQPASLCNLVGLKPTYGAISRYGIIAMGSSLDQVGPLTKTVADNEIIFNILKGQDEYDGTTFSDKTYPKSKEKKLYTLGIPRDVHEGRGIEAPVLKVFREKIEQLEKAGHKVEIIDLPLLKYSLAIYYIIMPAEVSTNLSRFDGMRYGLSLKGENLLETYEKTRGEGFGPEVRRRILLGTYVLSSGYYDAFYNRATALRRELTKEFENAFKKVDTIIMPTSPVLPFKFGEKSDPLAMYMADIFTITANMVGMPAISIPSGFGEIEGKKLPIGIQLMGNKGDEQNLFNIGKIMGA